MENKYNDNELLYLISEHEEVALELLFYKYEPLIKARIKKFKIKANCFDDYFQEGRFVLFRCIQRYSSIYNKTFNKYFDFYLQKHYMNLLKKERNYFYNTIVFEDLNFVMEKPFEYDKKIEVDETLLSDFERKVFQYKYLDNLKISEISKYLKCQPKMIYNAILRIKMKYPEINKKRNDNIKKTSR